MSIDLSVTRTLAVPPDQAWKAWSESEYVKQWWGPRGFTCPIADLDFRVGGTSLLCMTAPEFGDFYNIWTYTAILPHERVEYVSRFSDKDGTPIARRLPGVPDEVPHIVTFTPTTDGGTEVTVAEFGYETNEAADMSKGGLKQCLDKLVEAFQ